jgi:hypothetical protein
MSGKLVSVRWSERGTFTETAESADQCMVVARAIILAEKRRMGGDSDTYDYEPLRVDGPYVDRQVSFQER